MIAVIVGIAVNRNNYIKQSEHSLQCSCIQWFRLQYQMYAPLLFAVPNGGSRHIVEAKKLKQEGVLAGVSDVILLVSRNGFGSLCVEFKTLSGVQSEAQKQWQKMAENHGNKYVICRDFEHFKLIINNYLLKE